MEEALNKQSSYISELKTFITNFKKCSTQHRTHGYLKGRLSGIIEKWKDIEKQNRVLKEIYDPEKKEHVEDNYFKGNVFENTEEQYYTALGSIQTYLLAFESNQHQPHSNSQSNSHSEYQSQNSVSNSNAQVKLPKIELPKFNGEYENWKSFEDRFTVLIHKNERISNVEKLEYLKSCMEGKAGQTLTRYNITDGNYSLAWNRLKEKYNNVRLLQITQIENLLDQAPVRDEDANKLRNVLDKTQDSLAALAQLEVDTNAWDPILIVIISRKLPPKTIELWEQTLTINEVPTFKKFCNFLEQRYRTLERLEHTEGSTQASIQVSKSIQPKRLQCSACNGSIHSLMQCEKFKTWSQPNKFAFVKAKNICTNCLSTTHNASKCTSTQNCFKCGRKHHTLLHKPENDFPRHNIQGNGQSFNAMVTRNLTNTQSIGNSWRRGSELNQNKVENKQALFPTLLIQTRCKNGSVFTLRALLDQCSERSFIKQSIVQKIGASTYPIQPIEITGLEESVTARVEKETQISLIISPDENISMNAGVVDSLVSFLPRTPFSPNIFSNLKLADPTYSVPGSIDIMLGTEIYTQIITDGVLRSGGFLAQNTKLGWIVSGNSLQRSNQFMCLTTLANERVDDLLQKFWEIEEPNIKIKILSEDEKRCEESFQKSYKRTEDGRIQTKLPFKCDPTQSLGNSRNLAVARWLSMEKKLNKDPQLKEEYFKAMQEYLDLGHMVKVHSNVLIENGSQRISHYYIPHHAVVKPERTTTKTRIVFDASAKTSSKLSLNDVLLIGPTVQDSLITRLCKWRQHKYVLRGDITKMYRQIRVYEEDCDYQRIVFRFNKNQPIEDYKLLTLTFGTASAPFMAIRSIQKLAETLSEEFPIGSQVVSNDFHVDDLLSGASTVEEVIVIYKQVTNLLISAGLPMRKWASNNMKVLNHIPEEHREFQSNLIQDDESIKTLGIGWLPATDSFFFTSQNFEFNEMLTKRKFLSQVAKIFDPLGWLGPIVINAKTLFQSMWNKNLDWDDQVPPIVEKEWTEFRRQLSVIELIRIPRWYGYTPEVQIELHGFCDASITAYGAVVYVKTTSSTGSIATNIVLAKSRVAPIKTITLPRLELCGCQLLAQLIDQLSKELKIQKKYCWTDSAISLCWINSMPDSHKAFISHRIAEIQSLTNSNEWRHVATKDNPADCLSRGITAEELLNHPLWWTGPNWLKLHKERWPKNPNVSIPEDKLEQKSSRALVSIPPNLFLTQLIERFSTIDKLLRVTARIRKVFSKNRTRYLKVEEIEFERKNFIKHIQSIAFKDEINSIQSNKSVSSTSNILNLNPIIVDGILRVGGRLKEALVPFDQKHQIILPKNSHFTHLIIDEAHILTKHGGTQLTTTHTRQQYWIVNAKVTVRKLIKNCIICHKYTRQTQNQIMADLPIPRVNLTKPFAHTGIDYAGPIDILKIRQRGKRMTEKGYIVVFVCFSTKAIHLELVTGLTSEAFLLAFKRFISRRGTPSDMYSDNGTTFVGAKKQINKDLKIITDQIEKEVADVTLSRGVQWHFIPPYAPHWGGLWEAGVKSTKYHFRRMIGKGNCTFEEITTVLSEIEACLNSRPLCPLSNDPNDLSILTPGHFLVGDSIVAPPRPSLLNSNPNRLSKFNQMSQLFQHFKKRWQREYFGTLQARNKWAISKPNIEENDLVLVKPEDMNINNWILGRIVETKKDESGKVRMVRIKTQDSIITRPITKVSLLPLEKESKE